MTVRHRQRKGAKSGFFLYAREKAFSKPPAFSAETARRFPAHGQITLHAPQAFSASFRPSTAPLPAFFATKRGFFAPNARHTRLFARPNAPVLPRRCPVLPGAHPDEAPACPSFARDPGARAHPGTPEAPACAAFLPARARFHPPCAARTPEGCLARRRNHPAVRRLPARCRRPPPEGQPAAPPRHSLGAGNPDCRGRLSRFAVKKCATPRGESDPWA